ncbi:MAG TPA: 50S ribosomal protein L25 [Firmicutes bacterium]|jgi:large subunit ribosomal protein L25|nr:50S ribosomal protein L25 [Bacillota bacterium]
MAEVIAEVRKNTGTSASKADRQVGLVPAVLYGEGVEAPVHLVVDKIPLEKLLSQHGLGSILTVKVGQTEYPAMIKEVQHDPVRGHIIHADFQGISLTEVLQTVVPIVLEGTPEGVKEGGTVQHQLRELEVECLPQDLPDNVVLEIGHLALTESLFVRDLTVPENVEIITDPDEVVVTVLAPRPEEEEEVEEEEAIDEELVAPEGEEEEEEEADDEE